MKQGSTELVFIVDRSGSMSGFESDTIGGINSTLKRHRELEGECNVSIVLFNTESQVIVDRKPIAEVKDLTRRDYQAGGCTALLDAVGGSLKHAEMVQHILPEEYRAEKVIFVIVTDGLENASRKYSYQQVKNTISAKTELGWEFLFLGANIDAAAEAGRIGIAYDRAATYTQDTVGNAVMYDAVADATCCMRSASVADPRMGGGWADKIHRDRKRRNK